jgi:hypothetical protein
MEFHMDFVRDQAERAYAETLEATTNIQVFDATAARGSPSHPEFDAGCADTVRRDVVTSRRSHRPGRLHRWQERDVAASAEWPRRGQRTRATAAKQSHFDAAGPGVRDCCGDIVGHDTDASSGTCPSREGRVMLSDGTSHAALLVSKPGS